MPARSPARRHRPRTSTRLPIQPGREDIADDRCPICTLIHLAGALVPAEMPSLPMPSVFAACGHQVAECDFKT
jgi:hypothetical protein